MDGQLRIRRVVDYSKLARLGVLAGTVTRQRQKQRTAADSPVSSGGEDGGGMEELSGVVVIIIIAGVVLASLMTFIFIKRQIMRFTLRNRRGPHIPIGNDARKALRREIERRIDCIQKIAQEPKLLWPNDDQQQPLPPYYYRMRAVDDVKTLEREIARADGSVRHAYDSLRAFLVTTLAAVLSGAGQRMIHQFCDMYEHARHDPSDFGTEQYTAYERLLAKLIEAAKQLKQLNSRRSSPSRTPRKQTKLHALLDPARLRPPPIDSKTQLPASSELTAGQHSKVNLTLGFQCEDLLDDTALQPPADRDLHLIRNRLKTPAVGDTVPTAANESSPSTQAEADDNEITSISAVPFYGTSSNV